MMGEGGGGGLGRSKDSMPGSRRVVFALDGLAIGGGGFRPMEDWLATLFS